jgi:hypothetical protein
MPIVFDQVEGVVQRSPEQQQGADPESSDTAAPPTDAEKLAGELDRLQRRKQRLSAD